MRASAGQSSLAVKPLGLPEWTMSQPWVLFIAALPIALVVAWAFEVTPDGVKRTESAHPAAAGRTGQ
jgi:adenylate cyclase